MHYSILCSFFFFSPQSRGRASFVTRSLRVSNDTWRRKQDAHERSASVTHLRPKHIKKRERDARTGDMVKCLVAIVFTLTKEKRWAQCSSIALASGRTKGRPEEESAKRDERKSKKIKRRREEEAKKRQETGLIDLWLFSSPTPTVSQFIVYCILRLSSLKRSYPMFPFLRLERGRFARRRRTSASE